MKKLLSLLLAIILIVSICVTPAYATDSTVVEETFGNVSVKTGDEVCVPVTIKKIRE